jgi:hypothetical protein
MVTRTYVGVGACKEGERLTEAKAVDQDDAGHRAADTTRLQDHCGNEERQRVSKIMLTLSCL